MMKKNAISLAFLIFSIYLYIKDIIMKRIADINEIENYYTVTEDGMVWSKIRNRWLKPQVNRCGYVFYFISYGIDRPSWMFAHTLVALKYIGLPLTIKHEIDHFDDNRMNNHYSNLRWVTHSENTLKVGARNSGRPGYWLGKHRSPASLETKLKMANAKKKRVQFEFMDKKIVYDSIDDAASGIDTYRKRIYLCIKNEVMFKGGYLSFIKDEF
jgi:hypothetical protein